jgi:putative ABC transport system substrate-binding protein
MKRRTVLARTAVGALASITAALAGAQSTALPVVGFLGGTGPAPEIVAPILQGLADSGYDEGRNLTVEYRWAHDQADRLPALVADLVRSGAAVIVTSGGLVPAQAAKAATSTVPIVFEVGRDPVASGLVASLNRPGGNATGVYMLTSALNASAWSCCMRWCRG